MKQAKIERIKKEAVIIIETKMTIRNLADKMHLSKSTVHKDLHIHLKKIDNSLYQKVQKIFNDHIQVRHIIGGEKTREKYQKNRNRNTVMVE